ncbi:MAG: macro domain-containing protein [Acidimicrobiales bacterium]
MTHLSAELGDITTYTVDAIVNAANSALAGGGGVDGAIHAAGGPEIARQCREIIARDGPLATGAAVVTGPGLLPCRLLIHTVGPVWSSHTPADADKLLGAAYHQSVAAATTHDCRSMAFPNVSTGVYGFPKPRAANVAIETVVDAVRGSGMEQIVFVCFDQVNLDLYLDLLAKN